MMGRKAPQPLVSWTRPNKELYSTMGPAMFDFFCLVLGMADQGLIPPPSYWKAFGSTPAQPGPASVSKSVAIQPGQPPSASTATAVPDHSSSRFPSTIGQGDWLPALRAQPDEASVVNIV